jgi:hypothetical protein
VRMRKLALWLAHPRMVFWLMPALMALLVVGTLAQREIGLYEAERLFFAGWIVWLGPVPLPGMYPLLALLALALIAKLTLKSPWSSAQAGNIVTHLGALLLMLGGLLTAVSVQEGYLSAAEGDTSRVVHDYHAREMVLLDASGQPLWRADLSTLAAGDEIADSPIGAFTIEKLYRNAIPAWREEAGEAEQGIAQQLDLAAQPLEKQDEANLAGIILNSAKHGRFLLFEPMQNRPEIEFGEQKITLAVRKTQRVLPFSVKLIDFEKIAYAGTSMAREYQSIVEIDEGSGIRWQAMIRMNEPLRVMGYTLYQSSFVERSGETISVLAVVKNKGRVFPYVASLVIGIGLLVHLRMRRKKVRA